MVKTPSDGLRRIRRKRTSGKGREDVRAAHLALKKETIMKKLLFGVLFASMGFGATTAMADGWPLSVLGNWSVLANQSSGTLSITSQGSGLCQSISGTIFGNTIVGFYCPYSGRIHFLRNSGATTFQDYTANVSMTGATLHMGGTFASDLGAFGEYSFQGSK